MIAPSFIYAYARVLKTPGTALARQEIAGLQSAKHESKRSSGFKGLFRSKAKSKTKTIEAAKELISPPSTPKQAQAQAEADLYGPYAEIDPDPEPMTHTDADTDATDPLTSPSKVASFPEAAGGGRDGGDDSVGGGGGGGGEPAFGEPYEITLTKRLDEEMRSDPL